jgi:protein phosphatase
MAQSAEVLAQLHAEGIVGCRMTLDNLLVQPGDRVLLLDPAGCREAPANEDEAAREHLSDVRLLAGELERWYIAVRDVGSILSSLDTGDGAGSEEDGMLRVEGAVFSAANVTGPLAAVLSPVFVLAGAREGEYPTAAALAEALGELYEQSVPSTNLKVWSGRASDVGQVRQINEDSVLTLEATVLEHGGNLPVALYVIADGMGGHQSGEVASSIAARTVGAVVNSSLIGPVVAGDPVARDPANCAALLRQSVLEANRRIAELARERHSDLGTTVVAALVIGNDLTIVNAGDSRAYLLRDNVLTVLTTDHSLVMQLVLAGQIERDDIYTHPRRNEIYRALGDPRITEDEIDIYTHRLQPGDGLLLCSDGLWDFVRDPAIEQILQNNGGPQSVCDALVDEANRQGGEDNVSVIYARVLSGEE